MGKTLPVFFIILLALASRLFFWNESGAYFFPDEGRYEILDKSEYFWKDIFEIWGRPGFGIFYYPALLFEGPIPGLVENLIVNVLNILLVYFIARRLTSGINAFLVILVATFSLPMVYYIRHLLPYDAGLFLILAGIAVWQKYGSSFFFGLFIGLSFLVYPSHSYYFLPIPLMLLIFTNKRILERLVSTLKLGIGAILPLILMEFFSTAVGAKSYITSLKDLSGTVTQGDFIFSLTFIKDYIEGFDGIIGLAATLIFIISIGLKSKTTHYKILAIYILAMFLVFEIFSHILQNTVLYARTVRPLYLLIILSGTMSFFDLFSMKRVKNIPIVNLAFLAVLIVISFPSYLNFKNITYKDDFLDLAKSFKVEDDVETQVSSLELEHGKIYITNPPLLYPYYGTKKLACDKQILLEKPDPMFQFKPYRFEGHDIAMRRFLENDPPGHEVFKCI